MYKLPLNTHSELMINTITMAICCISFNIFYCSLQTRIRHDKNATLAYALFVVFCALYPLGPVATLRFCHLRPRCVSKQRRTTNVIISDRVWWIWCDAGLATVATRPQRSPHSVASNSRPDYFAATRSRSLFLTINECCVSAAAAAIWEIQWRRSTPQLAPVDTGGQSFCIHFVLYLSPGNIQPLK